jgi:hypothetical protein
MSTGTTPAAAPRLMTDILATLASPATVVLAHFQPAGRLLRLRVFAVGVALAVEQTPGAASTYELALMDAADVLGRLATFCELADRPRPVAAPCAVSFSTFVRVLSDERAAAADIRRRLLADGVPSADATFLAAALAGCERLGQVTLLRRPAPGRLDGATTAWLDGGTAGLWRVDAPTLAHSGDMGVYGEVLMERHLVTLTPTSERELKDEFGQGFPTGGRDGTTD